MAPTVDALIPRLGFGTALVPDESLPLLLRVAIAQGVRLFDTAEGYGSETAVGRAVRLSVLPRSAFWIVSKTKRSPMEAIRGTLRALGMGYIDVSFPVLIIHLLHQCRYGVKINLS